MAIAASAGFDLVIAGHVIRVAGRLTLTLPAGPYSDVTRALKSINLDTQNQTEFPDGIRDSIGFGTLGGQCVLAGSVDPHGDPSKSAAWLFNPDDPTSPLYRYVVKGSGVTWDSGVRVGGSTAPELLRKLTGRIATVDNNHATGEVTLGLVDMSIDWGDTPDIAAVITAAPYNAGLTSEYAMDAVIRSMQGTSSWPATRPGAVLSVGFRSSVWPEVGTFDAASSASPTLTFVEGVYGTALGQIEQSTSTMDPAPPPIPPTPPPPVPPTSISFPATSGDIQSVSILSTVTPAMTVPKPANTADGDVLVAVVYCQVAGSVITPPTGGGWGLQEHAVKPGTRGLYVFTKLIPSAAAETATNYTFTSSAAGRGLATVFRMVGARSATADATALDNYYSAASSVVTMPAAVAVATGTMLLAITFANGTSDAVFTATAPGFTNLVNINVDDSGPTSTLNIDFMHLLAAGSTGSVTETLNAPAASSGGMLLTFADASAVSSSGPGDSGVNQTGTAALQQTGAGIVRLQDLTAGADLTATIAAAVGSEVSFAAGTFSWSDFLHGLGGSSAPSGNTASGLLIKQGILGLLGAGSASTILKMVANSSTKGSTVPTKGTNGLYYIDATNLPDGFVMDGVNVQGTAQGHLFGGIFLQNPGNVTFSNDTFSGMPGNSGSPPGETFLINIYKQAAGTTISFNHCTFDGAQTGTNVGAALLGSNNTKGVINAVDCLFENARYSAAPTIWELAKGAVFNLVRPVIRNCHRNIGNEAQGGTINIYDPLFDDPTGSGEDDIRITWTAAYNSGPINVYFTTMANWTAFIANRTNKKILTSASTKKNYGGSNTPYTGANRIKDFCHVFIGDGAGNFTEQVLADYWTITGS